ncbi:MAG: hypothetical protein V1888_02245 [archaeon]
MATKKKSIIDLAKEVGRHALSKSPVEGTVSYEGERYESGTTIIMQYLFSFPQGEATDSTSHNTKEEDTRELDPIENGVGLLIYRLKNPALGVSYIKKDESSAILQVIYNREKSSLEEGVKTPVIKETPVENKNFYVLPDSSRELYKYLVRHNPSLGSLAFLAKTHIDVGKKEVHVPDNFTKGRIENKYREAIERMLNSKIKYIVDPKLRSNISVIDLKNL